MEKTKIKEERSLGARFPKVAKQWAQDLNGDVTTFDVLHILRKNIIGGVQKTVVMYGKLRLRAKQVMAERLIAQGVDFVEKKNTP